MIVTAFLRVGDKQAKQCQMQATIMQSIQEMPNNIPGPTCHVHGVHKWVVEHVL